MSFAADFQAAAGPLLRSHFGTPAKVLLAGASAWKDLTIRWSPQESLVSYFSDGSQEVSRGVARIDDPADWSPVGIERDQAVIDGRLYVVAQTGTLSPVLELQMVARETKSVEQESRRVKR